MNKETNLSFYLFIGFIAIILNGAMVIGIGYYYGLITRGSNLTTNQSASVQSCDPEQLFEQPINIDVDVSRFGKYKFVQTISRNPRERSRRQELIERLEDVENEIDRLQSMPNKRLLLNSMYGRLSFIKNRNASKLYRYKIKD